jgi:hypothetical protein
MKKAAVLAGLLLAMALSYLFGAKRFMMEKVFDEQGRTAIWQRDRLTGKRYLMFKGRQE